jgi:hypothetical protein
VNKQRRLLSLWTSLEVLAAERQLQAAIRLIRDPWLAHLLYVLETEQVDQAKCIVFAGVLLTMKLFGVPDGI